MGKQHIFNPYWKKIFGGTPEKNKKIVCKGRLKICKVILDRLCKKMSSSLYSKVQSTNIKKLTIVKKGAATNIKKMTHVVKKVQPQILKN